VCDSECRGCRGVPGWPAASGNRSGSGLATRQLPPDPALTGHATPTAASYPSVTYKIDAHPAPGPPYRPHLSLLYARDLPGERKPAIADGLGLALPVTISVDAAEIWADFRDEVTRWRRVARVPLAG
jgi:hypothetical protein